MVVTSAFGLVVVATSTPGGSPTVLAAGSHPLLADHDDDGSGSFGSGSGRLSSSSPRSEPDRPT